MQHTGNKDIPYLPDKTDTDACQASWESYRRGFIMGAEAPVDTFGCGYMRGMQHAHARAIDAAEQVVAILNGLMDGNALDIATQSQIATQLSILKIQYGFDTSKRQPRPSRPRATRSE